MSEAEWKVHRLRKRTRRTRAPTPRASRTVAGEAIVRLLAYVQQLLAVK